MYCENCCNDIPVGGSYFRHGSTELCFCSLNCLTDWLIDSMNVTSKINDEDKENEVEEF